MGHLKDANDVACLISLSREILGLVALTAQTRFCSSVTGNDCQDCRYTNPGYSDEEAQYHSC